MGPSLTTTSATIVEDRALRDLASTSQTGNKSRPSEFPGSRLALELLRVIHALLLRCPTVVSILKPYSYRHVWMNTCSKTARDFIGTVHFSIRTAFLTSDTRAQKITPFFFFFQMLVLPRDARNPNLGFISLQSAGPVCYVSSSVVSSDFSICHSSL